MVCIEQLNKIKETLEIMTISQQIEVLKIFINNDIEISENNNGSFINLSNLSPVIINKLEEYIIFVSNQNENLIKIESEKRDIKEKFFENKIKTNKDIEYNEQII
tara:strand:- start:266 stop:580 length:315 start_codon:yes stop_codon:yes gene_type:complete